jgi:diguanylate cyclase (GGDEF)-like protein
VLEAGGRSIRRGVVRDLLLVGNVLLVGVFLMARAGSGYSPLWDGWIGNLLMVVPVVACFAQATRSGPRRVAALWLGAGMLCWAAGNVIFVWWTQFQADPPVPSPADIAYFGFYFCVAAAMVSLARPDMGSFSRMLWLDGALGAAGAATALTVVLRSAFSGVGGSPGAVVVSLGYPIGDVLLLAMICGLLAVRGVRGGSMWLWLAVGLAIFLTADVIYVLQVQSADFVVGTILSMVWAVGITIICLAIWRPERSRPVEPRRSGAALVVPTLATLTAVAALVSFSIGTSPIIVVLAILTLLLAAARTAASFHQVQALSTVRRQALTDELTGLGNRRDLFEAGEDQLQTVRPGERIVLLLLDLDNFKLVNDTLGHQCGDELLREAARRLARDVMRPDLVIRLGGDEFALLVRLGADGDARRIAERVLDHLAKPVVVAGVEIRMQASAGIAVSHGSGLTIVELLRRADVAMYAAKAVGKRLESYDASLDEANHARLETVGELPAAFLEGQFILHYQPKIAIDTGNTFGAEALVRWQHPTRGLLYPDAFLEIVEQSGSMGRLTQVVLELAVEQLATWHSAGVPVRVAVNLSASDLLDAELPERIMRLLSAHSVPVNALELEITESVLMTDPGRACALLNELHGLGLRIAVDDYGTGYCSLAYLRDLPIDELKIDRSFIAALTQDPRSGAIVSSTIELAHALNFSVVAEGVEDASTLDVLEACGCDSVQGFYFSRPLPAEEFAVWARTHARDPAAPRESGGWPAVSVAA